MDILNKILTLREARGWSEYKLAEMSELTQSTISTWYRKNIIPSISSLEAICNAFNITLSQFFSNENECLDLTETQKEMLSVFSKLTIEQQKKLINFLKTI